MNYIDYLCFQAVIYEYIELYSFKNNVVHVFHVVNNIYKYIKL